MPMQTDAHATCKRRATAPPSTCLRGFAARGALALALGCGLCSAAPSADEITALPGWTQPLPSKQYSGYIHVPDGPGKQEIFMHYVFVESQGSPSADPLVLWQQGGPGSSGFGFGYMAELGPFHLSAESMANVSKDGVPALWPNPYSWDTRANVLILEHPPGTGFSYCAKDGKPVTCEWNDDTQAEAFVQEIEGWLDMFPEFSEHDFYLTGESYAGLLLPNLMHQIVLQGADTKIKLKAAAIGNGCTGTPGQSVEHPGTCNLGGDFDTQHNVELFAGHGMISKASRDAIFEACNFTCEAELQACQGRLPRSKACQKALGAMDSMGEYNIYNILDTCGSGNMSAFPAKGAAVDEADVSRSPFATFGQQQKRLSAGLGGGPPYSWTCGMGDATSAWMNNPVVRKAIHVKDQAFFQNKPWPFRGMNYNTYTHASIDLYPELLQHFRIVIYNGDADACVPYNGNEDWTTAMAAKLQLRQFDAWRPWVVDNVPAGYVTTWGTPSTPDASAPPLAANFTFITVKSAGHMVPQYQPPRALALFERFLAGGPF